MDSGVVDQGNSRTVLVHGYLRTAVLDQGILLIFAWIMNRSASVFPPFSARRPALRVGARAAGSFAVQRSIMTRLMEK